MTLQKVPNELVADVRQTLTANRTYYVRTDGSDSNSGFFNTAGGAVLTIQKAIDLVAALDISTFNVTIQIQDGTWSAAVTVSAPWVGSGTVTLLGNTVTPTNCNFTHNLAVVNSGSRLTVSGFKFATTSGSGTCILAQDGAVVTLGASIVFGTTTNAHTRANGAGATIILPAAYSVDGSTVTHWSASPLGYINAFNSAVTFSNTLSFTQFALADRNAFINANGASFLGTAGSVTGTKFISRSGAFIYSTGGITAFPGNSAGLIQGGGYGNPTNTVSTQITAFACERGSSAVGNWFAFGNGSATNSGPVMPFAGRMVAATMQVSAASAGTHTVQVLHNGVVNASYQLSLSWSSGVATAVGDYSASPLTFAAGDQLNFQITAQPATAVWCLTFFVIFD